MCGILAVLGLKGDVTVLRKHLVELSARLRHRGPDWSGVYVTGQNILAHERLAIVGLHSGGQPMISNDGNIALTVNGEIYNYKQLIRDHIPDVKLKTGSDCEPLMYLYEKYGNDFLNFLQGDYAFVVTNAAKNTYLATRDPIGVCPLYWGKADDGSVWFASEMKALIDDCKDIDLFPPGHFYTPETGLIRWFNPVWWEETKFPEGSPDLFRLRAVFEQAVYRRLMSEVPYGVLLSGGLDSSLVAAVAARKYRELKNGAKILSFSIGLEGQSPDLVAAQRAAQFIGTDHHEFTFTVEDGIDAIPRLVWHLETYDVTTIRASTPMFLLSRKIKAMGVKMVLSCEGSDEILGGYLYFGHAPNAEEFHKETVKRVKNLHTSDCLRANKSTSAWGLEVRVPFLDRDFLDEAFSFDAQNKMFGNGKIEKYVMRKAFDRPEDPFLPDNILWRVKEQFSDGVGYLWIDSLIAHANKHVSDADFEKRAERFPVDPPATKEAYYYRSIFDEQFKHHSAAKTVKTWVPTWGKSKDPSGRAQKFHTQYDEKK